MSNVNIKILLVTHKPFKIPEGKFFVPIHAGRSIAFEASKDGKIDIRDYDWLINHTIGDNTSDNISDKNRNLCEVTALYWAWKNYEQLSNPDYIGLMHYRRHFIFNESYYNSKPQNKLEKALSYVDENFIDEDYIKNIGLYDENIVDVCKNYDLVVSKDSDLTLINKARNIRQDYSETIAGCKLKDFDLMVDVVKRLYPEYCEVVDSGILGYKKSLYQMFIMTRELFFEYCEFLFSILFELDKRVDFSSYSNNGKRSLGYLAEELLAIFVWKKQQDKSIRIKKLGCTLLEFPYDEVEIRKVLSNGKPKFSKFLYYKAKSFLLTGDAKQIVKEKYQSIRNARKSYKKLKELVKLQGENNAKS